MGSVNQLIGERNPALRVGVLAQSLADRREFVITGVPPGGQPSKTRVRVSERSRILPRRKVDSVSRANADGVAQRESSAIQAPAPPCFHIACVACSKQCSATPA